MSSAARYRPVSECKSLRVDQSPGRRRADPSPTARHGAPADRPARAVRVFPARTPHGTAVRDRAGVRGVRAGQHAGGDVTPRRQRLAGGARGRRAAAGVRRRRLPRLPAAAHAARHLRGGPLPRAARPRAAPPAGARLPGERVRRRAASGGRVWGAVPGARLPDAGAGLARRAPPRHRVLRRGPRRGAARARHQRRAQPPAPAAARRARRAAQPARQLQPHVRRAHAPRRREAVLGRRPDEPPPARAVQARQGLVRRTEADVRQAAQSPVLRRPEHARQRLRIEQGGRVDVGGGGQPAPPAARRGQAAGAVAAARRAGRVRGHARRAVAARGPRARRGVPARGALPGAAVRVDGGARARTPRGHGAGAAQRPVRVGERDPRGRVLRQRVRRRVVAARAAPPPQLRVPAAGAGVLLPPAQLHRHRHRDAARPHTSERGRRRHAQQPLRLV